MDSSKFYMYIIQFAATQVYVEQRTWAFYLGSRAGATHKMHFVHVAPIIRAHLHPIYIYTVVNLLICHQRGECRRRESERLTLLVFANTSECVRRDGCDGSFVARIVPKLFAELKTKFCSLKKLRIRAPSLNCLALPLICG